MNIHELPIISEVYGEGGAGKNSFCFYVSRNITSLWIEAYPRLSTKRADSLRLDLESIYVCGVKNIHVLICMLKAGEIQSFIKDHGVELVVVNRIEDLEEPCAKGTKNYEEVAKCLKRLYHTHKVKTIIVSETPSLDSVATRGRMCTEGGQEVHRMLDQKLCSYLVLQKYLKKAIPVSSIQSVSWEYCMPTKICIQRTPEAGVRSVKIVKPDIPGMPEYVMRIRDGSIDLEKIN
ncbi:uncharacterized protein NEMAJ01_1809 [Nematocida major]|uniref:uncharacterized protein n=1 Tax=Nematocida major TaxID=1912982 RepID=UPI002008D8EF|nr:uncharacterized protein NEMAJ01_1809 [Nematocida major]KAH9386913.1 hypothetical protein NEMAJ01_1809 [Nematocida major]